MTERKTVQVGIICAQDIYMTMAFVEQDGHGYNNPATKEAVDAEVSRLEEHFRQTCPERVPFKKWEFLEDDEIPTDLTYRMAWHRPNGKMEVNVEKAKHIHRNHLREHRAVKLAALDIEYMRAHEVNDVDKMKAIASKKQKLRDITTHPDIEAATTVDHLKAITIETHGA